MKNSIIVVACPDQGEGINPEALGLAFHHQGPTFINAYCQAVTNLVDRDKGGGGWGNDLSRPRRSELSKCFVLLLLLPNKLTRMDIVQLV